MKKSHASLEFPVVIKQIKDMVVLSCPDFKYSEVVVLPKNRKIDRTFILKITEKLAKIWLKNHLRLSELATNEMPCPTPTKIRMTIDEKKQKPLTAPQLARMAGVSADTIRRAMDRGDITCEKTFGGHRKISPEAAMNYLERRGFQS